MANKPGTANFFPDVPTFPSMGTFQPVYGKFDLTTYIQGASDYEIMAFLVGKYNACLEAYGTITKLSTDTITACKQLQEWINSWFDNLDVQEELNKKIDGMVADGSFGRLLHQTFDEQINQQTTSAVTTWLVANVTPTGSAVVVDKSLSIEGAAADGRVTGTYIDKLSIANTGVDIDVTISAVSTGKLRATVTLSGDGYIFTQNKFYSAETGGNTLTIDFNVPSDYTYSIYMTPDRTIGCVRLGEYIPINAVILWIGFLQPNGNIISVVYDANGIIGDKTLSNSKYPANAKATGTYIGKIPIANTGLNVGVTISAVSTGKLRASVTMTGDGYLFTQNNFIWANTGNNPLAVEFDVPGDYTYIIYLNTNKTIGCVRLGEYIPVNSIIIWIGFLQTSGNIISIIFDANNMVLNRIVDDIDVIKKQNLQTIGSNTASIFNKVVCCGDSYTSGHISTSAQYNETTEAFAWPKYAAHITGNEYINCGCSGANVLTWQTDSRGLPKAKASGVSQCYIIGLGLNDIAVDTERYVTLGTSADIGTDAQTYYGGYSKIIRELHSISPNAIIFCQTMPMASGLQLQYNEAIRAIVSNYASTYNTKLLNLNDYDGYYRMTTVAQNASNGHYTAAGYQQLAQILCYAISDYINAHPKEFYDVNTIPYDSTT